jgi:Ca2+:H+ antiporter
MELPTLRNSLYNKLGQSTATAQRPPSVNRKVSIVNMNVPSQTGTTLPRETSTSTSAPQTGRPTSPSQRKVFVSPQQTGLHPVLESVDHAVKNSDLRNLQIPETTDDFTRAVTVATVSALRHQQQTHLSPGRLRSAVEHESTGAGGGHGGHDAPAWSRTTSASVLLGCTALYALIAGICFDPSFLGACFHTSFFL